MRYMPVGCNGAYKIPVNTSCQLLIAVEADLAEEMPALSFDYVRAPLVLLRYPAEDQTRS